MKRREIIITVLLVASISCTGQNKNDSNKTPTSDEINVKIENAKKVSKLIKGRFYRIDRIDDRDFNLQIIAKNDSVISFITMIVLSKSEIGRLKTAGDNIEIYYQEYYNPVRKRKENIVTYTHFIYEHDKN
jgi:DNA polymerase III sliding clamp (beta) subunit (PCNA family)